MNQPPLFTPLLSTPPRSAPLLSTSPHQHQPYPRYDFVNWQLDQRAGTLIYPLRPELIESTYLMYRASGDSSWLWAGQDFLSSIERWTRRGDPDGSRPGCGYAAVKVRFL